VFVAVHFTHYPRLAHALRLSVRAGRRSSAAGRACVRVLQSVGRYLAAGRLPACLGACHGGCWRYLAAAGRAVPCVHAVVSTDTYPPCIIIRFRFRRAVVGGGGLLRHCFVGARSPPPLSSSSSRVESLVSASLCRFLLSISFRFPLHHQYPLFRGRRRLLAAPVYHQFFFFSVWSYIINIISWFMSSYCRGMVMLWLFNTSFGSRFGWGCWNGMAVVGCSGRMDGWTDMGVGTRRMGGLGLVGRSVGAAAA
jgi:hypothetical protein